jgi:hypothetical protein
MHAQGLLTLSSSSQQQLHFCITPGQSVTASSMRASASPVAGWIYRLLVVVLLLLW